MPIERPRLFLLAALWLTLSLVAAACGGTSDSAAPSPTPDPNAALLPPPTEQPVESEPVDAVPVEPTPIVVATADVVSIEEPTVVSCLSLRARVAQLLLPLVTQPELGGAAAFAASGDLGAIGLLGSPDENLAADLQALQLSSFVPVMVASDEEGGSVQRLADLLGPLPSASSDAQSKSPDVVRSQWLEYGARVKALGIDVIFGPVLDVGSGPGIESRSYGADPMTVTAFGQAVADGLLEAGITPVFKHFPGHGHATADSHLELPTTPSIAELRATDLVPYVQIFAEQRYREQAAVMIGHLSVPGLSDETPTSLSPETVNGLLRGELGFGGLVFTDALNMGAIVNTYGLLEAIELSLFAGADIAILGSLADLTPALDYLVGRAEVDPTFAAIVDNRAARVMAAKGQAALCQGAQ